MYHFNFGLPVFDGRELEFTFQLLHGAEEHGYDEHGEHHNGHAAENGHGHGAHDIGSASCGC